MVNNIPLCSTYGVFTWTGIGGKRKENRKSESLVYLEGRGEEEEIYYLFSYLLYFCQHWVEIDRKEVWISNKSNNFFQCCPNKLDEWQRWKLDNIIIFFSFAFT